MFEHRGQPVVRRSVFLARWAKFALASWALVGTSLGLGMVGYRWLEGMSWVDSFLNAAMLMGGMGPVSELRTDAGKVFAGIYALYCGLVLIVSVGIFMAPVYHRFIHRFHLEDLERENSGHQRPR